MRTLSNLPDKWYICSGRMPDLACLGYRYIGQTEVPNPEDLMNFCGSFAFLEKDCDFFARCDHGIWCHYGMEV